MAKEIEFKYRAEIIGPMPEPDKTVYSWQRYLIITKHFEWRVRLMSKDQQRTYFTSIKFGNGFVRHEFERIIPPWLGETLLLLAFRQLLKTRRVYGRWEVDVFERPKHLKGLVLAECEVLNRGDIPPTTPDGLRLIEDVTNDTQWQNKNLVKRLPPRYYNQPMPINKG